MNFINPNKFKAADTCISNSTLKLNPIMVICIAQVFFSCFLHIHTAKLFEHWLHCGKPYQLKK
ncbi:MAG TPA: hypothetical protein VFH08_07990 [Chitinophagaceae bacterium]|nr:hypothetical protein [Chitinophagaceae bacterium]